MRVHTVIEYADGSSVAGYGVLGLDGGVTIDIPKAGVINRILWEEDVDQKSTLRSFTPLRHYDGGETLLMERLPDGVPWRAKVVDAPPSHEEIEEDVAALRGIIHQPGSQDR